MKASPLPGGGPWRILEECPALLHNTVSVTWRGSAGSRCICPRGLWLLARHRRREAESKRIARAGGRPLNFLKRPSLPPTYMRNVNKRMPDLYGGLCQTGTGRHIASGVLEESGTVLEGYIRLHKEMCTACPLLPACRKGVLESERHAGEWGGVYGGLAPKDRKKIRERWAA